MKILCVLQNAWGSGRLSLIFQPNPRNKSAKVIRKIVGNEHTYYFSNTTDEVTPTAKGAPKPNYKHFEKIIKQMHRFDLILVCGVQARKTVEKYQVEIDQKGEGKPILFIPHPASRTLSNEQMSEINKEIIRIYENNYKRI